LQLRKRSGETRMRGNRVCLAANFEHPGPETPLDLVVATSYPTNERAHRISEVSFFARALAFAQSGPIDIACKYFDDPQTGPWGTSSPVASTRARGALGVLDLELLRLRPWRFPTARNNRSATFF